MDGTSVIIKTNMGFIHINAVDDYLPIEWLN